MENILVGEIEEMLNLQITIFNQIRCLENSDYELLLTLRYINFKSWEEISIEMSYEYSWVHRLHGRALKAFEPLIERGEQIESKH